MNDAVKITESILSSAKYRDLCPELVGRVVSDMLKKHSPQDAEKAARERLHAVTGAFMSDKEEKRILKQIASVETDEDLEKVLSLHASTRERLPLSQMDALFERIFSVTGRPGRVLDLACGITPVYLAKRGFSVTGIDLHRSLESIGEVLPGATMLTRDLMNADNVPCDRFDLALAMKLIPVLETERRGAGKELLSRVNARHLVVTYPTRTLSGKKVGMESHYAEMMKDCLPDDMEIFDSFVFGSELLYILKEVDHA